MSRGTIELAACGQLWKFDFGMNGWRRIEKLTGKRMQQILDELTGNASLFCEVVQGALQRHHPDVTIDEAGDIATELGDSLIKAAVDAMHRGEDEGQNPMRSLKAAS